MLHILCHIVIHFLSCLFDCDLLVVHDVDACEVNGGHDGLARVDGEGTQGDAADVVILELVDYKLPDIDDTEAKDSKKSTKKAKAEKADA